MSTATIDTGLLARVRAQVRAERVARHRLVEFVADLESTQQAVVSGYKSTERLLVDLLRVDQRVAKRLVLDASQLLPRVSMTGQPLPARLPATGAASGAGEVSAEHVHAVVEAMRTIEALPT